MVKNREEIISMEKREINFPGRKLHLAGGKIPGTVQRVEAMQPETLFLTLSE